MPGLPALTAGGAGPFALALSLLLPCPQNDELRRISVGGANDIFVPCARLVVVAGGGGAMILDRPIRSLWPTRPPAGGREGIIAESRMRLREIVIGEV